MFYKLFTAYTQWRSYGVPWESCQTEKYTNEYKFSKYCYIYLRNYLNEI